MKTQNNGKKTAVIAAAGVGAVALLGAGALALFSDVADTATGGTVGTVSVAVVNPDLQNKSNINPGDNDAGMWASLYKNDERHYIPTAEDPLFMPNASHDVDDYSSYVTVSTTPHDLTFTVANTGTKSIRTRQTFIVSVYQVEKDEEDKTSASFLPANVFTLYEDGTYYGTKNQDILDVHATTDYQSATATNKYVEELRAAREGDASDDNSKIVDAYNVSVADGLTQPWEELAYKYYIDADDNEYLVAVPASDMSFVKVGDMPTADDIEEIPFGTLIKAVKYVVYSDIFDGVTDDNDELAAEIEGAYGELSNLGDAETNVSVIPDAYHVMSTLTGPNKDKIVGGSTVYYKDQNGNTQYATADGTQFFYFNAFKNLLIAGQDCEVNGVAVKEGEFVIGVDAAAYIEENAMFPVELNTEVDKDGNIVFTDSLVDENGKALEGSVKVPLVHAYNAKEYRYMLGMSKMATNKYQGATVTIDIIVEAMQYRNTNGLADWEAISTNTITTALDFTDNKDTHTSITVPDKNEEPMMKDELAGEGNESDDAIEGDAYVGTTEYTR